MTETNEPERTRFVDPPPAEPVASAPVETPELPVEQASVTEAPAAVDAPEVPVVQELVIEAPAAVDAPEVPVEQASVSEAPAVVEAPEVPVEQASLVDAPGETAPVAAPELPVERAPEPPVPAAVAQPVTATPDAPAAATPAAAPSAPDQVATASPPAAPVEIALQPAPDGPGGGSRWLGLVAVVLAIAVAGVGFWFWTVLDRGGAGFLSGGDPFTQQGEPALRSAKAAVPVVLGYDYRTLDAGLAAAKKVTVDGDSDCAHKVDPKDPAYDSKAACFQSEFVRTHELVVKDFATRYKVVAVADVSAGGVVRVQDGRVTVLLYVNQQSTRSDAASPLVTQARVEMVMQKKGDSWLVADVTAL